MNSTHAIPSPTVSLSRIYLLEAWAELLRQWRTPAFVLPSLGFPLVFYVLFALILPGQWGSYQKATYLLATYAVFGIMGSALFSFGVGLALERENGLLELKRVSPMPIGAYFFAKICMALVFSLVIVCLLSAAGVLFGPVEISLIEWLKLLAVSLLGTLPFCAMGLFIGTLVRGQAAVAIVNLIYLPMAMLSGLWMPLFVLPKLIQQLAVIWPSWHLSQLALAAVGQLQAVPSLMHIGALLLMTLIFLTLAALRWNKV